MYSLGYRVDFETFKITATGGIYVRAFPQADQITIDSKISKKPGLFNNSVFVQSLLPKDHTVSVTKNGYYDYFKTIGVEIKEVTKLESILLIKKNLSFIDIIDNASYFTVAPNNRDVITTSKGTKGIDLQYTSLDSLSQFKKFNISQSGVVSNIEWSDDSNKALIEITNLGSNFYFYFDPQKTNQNFVKLSLLDKNSTLISFNPRDNQSIFYLENGTIYSLKNNKATLLIKNVVSYEVFDGNIFWTDKAGKINKSDTAGKLLSQTTENDREIQYFKAIKNSYKPIFSPDNKHLAYYNNNEIYLYSFNPEDDEKNNVKIFSTKEQIKNCYWLNNDYLILNVGDKITITEIDYRGEINTITLPQSITLSNDKKMDIKNPTVFFNRRDNKIYILVNDSLIASEKVTP